MKTVAIIGAGPAGLMAAEVLSHSGAQVTVYDAMPSVGRKFLMAGKSGLNLTHSEPFEQFVARYGTRRSRLEPMLKEFGADELRAWAKELGIETFVGTSGRVFPVSMKASPLLRAWLNRLQANGVTIQTRHKWLGWHEDHTLRHSKQNKAKKTSTRMRSFWRWAVGGLEGRNAHAGHYRRVRRHEGGLEDCSGIQEVGQVFAAM